MNYELVTKEELQSLRGALNLIERVSRDHAPELYFYGISSNPGLIAKANSALEEEFEMNEEGTAPSLTDVAVCLPVSSDTIHYLTGSGLILRGEYFAYVAGSDGVRTSELSSGAGEARVTDEDFSEIALSDTDAWLDDFLVKHGQKTAPAAVGRPESAVERSEAAVGKLSYRAVVDRSMNVIDRYLND